MTHVIYLVKRDTKQNAVTSMTHVIYLVKRHTKQNAVTSMTHVIYLVLRGYKTKLETYKIALKVHVSLLL